jgi:hypothetical protein
MANTKGTQISDAMMDVDMIVFIDTSGSMRTIDPGQNENRHTLAERQLVEIQGNNRGKVALCSFSNSVHFCPNGVPVIENGGTAMNEALKWALPMNGMGIDIVIVSDGSPNSKLMCLQTASLLDMIIHTVYIGPENDHDAIKFMKDLANAGKGKALTTEEVPQLGQKLQLLLSG